MTVDDPDHFVSRDNQVVLGHQVPLGQVEVGPAHPAHPHVYPHLARARIGDGPTEAPEGMGVDGTR